MVIVLVIICVTAVMLFKAKPSGFVPSEDGGRLFVTYQMADASSTTASNNVLAKLMKIVGSTPGILHYVGSSGFNILGGGGNNSGTMFCMLTPWDERTTPDKKVQGIMDNIRKRVAKAGIKNATVVSVQPPTIRGIGIAAGF